MTGKGYGNPLIRVTHGKTPFVEWLDKLRDRSARTRILIQPDRILLGNPGDRKSLGHGLYEMRIHYGPGYRVYYGGQGSHLVLLLSGRITGIVLMTRSKSYQEYLIAALADPLEAADYLNVALEDGDKELFLLALRNVAEARLGGISQLATATGLNRENLYRMLSGKGNPELKSLDRLLRALGLKLAVEADCDAA